MCHLVSCFCFINRWKIHRYLKAVFQAEQFRHSHHTLLHPWADRTQMHLSLSMSQCTLSFFKIKNISIPSPSRCNRAHLMYNYIETESALGLSDPIRVEVVLHNTSAHDTTPVNTLSFMGRAGASSVVETFCGLSRRCCLIVIVVMIRMI